MHRDVFWEEVSDIDSSDQTRCDDDHVTDLYESLYDECLSLARRILRSEHLAEEACQEAFLQLCRETTDIDQHRAVGLVKTLVRRRAIDSVRREERLRQMVFPEDGGPNPEDLVVLRDEARRVREAVGGLDEPYRTAIVLAFYRHRSYREVAELMGVPEGTAKWWIRTALDRLKRRVGS